ncbi:MAG: hybrid sensor histidine kinase/response regulator [Myxococcota bacterium]
MNVSPASERSEPIVAAPFDDARETVPFPLLELDSRGRLRHANAAARDQLGHPKACSLATCLGAAAAQEVLVRLDRAHRDGSSTAWSSELVLADGRMLPAQLAISVSDTSRGSWRAQLSIAPSPGLTTATITTPRPTTQEMARTPERIGAVQTLAAGVAHEIGNPLTYMFMCLDQLTRDLERTNPDPQLGELLHKTRQGAERVRDIVRGLSSYDRDHGRRDPVDVNRAVRNALEMARPELAALVRVHTSLEPVPSVRANPSRLVQVLYNLLVNAAHALEPGQANPAIGIETWLEGSWVYINVWDTGRGIDVAIRDQIFEPFVTSKPAGHGAGLGLAVCHNYVAELDGELDFDCDSDSEQGTRFTVRLPADTAEPAEATAPAPAAQAPDTADVPQPRVFSPSKREAAATARLLVVEDEPEIRRGLQAMLRRFGEVDVAESAAEARGLLSSKTNYDLVLCDLMMPGESGEELYGWISTARPELASRVVYVTGGGPRLQGTAAGEESEGPPCLLKPFRRQELYEFVRRNMARTAP